jgi:hypothetical protein
MAIDTMYPHQAGQPEEPSYAPIVMVRNSQNTAIEMSHELVAVGWDAGVDFYPPQVTENGENNAPFGEGNCGVSFMIDIGAEGLISDINAILAARAPG